MLLTVGAGAENVNGRTYTAGAEQGQDIRQGVVMVLIFKIENNRI